MNNKLILKTVAIVATLVVGTAAYFGLANRTSSNPTAEATLFTKIVSQNHLNKDQVLSGQQTELAKVRDIQVAKQVIENNLKIKTYITGENAPIINQKLKETQIYIDQADYAAAYNKINGAAVLSNNSVQKYLTTNKNSITELEKLIKEIVLTQTSAKDYKSINCYIKGEWASVSVMSQSVGDIALIVFKQDSGQWRVILNLGTSYNEQDLTAIGVPANQATAMIKFYDEQDYLSQIVL